MNARFRAIRSNTDRLEDTREARDLDRAIQQPAQYAGNGRIKSLGASGGVPARGRLSTGGIAVGEPVSASQGVIQGLPDAVTRENLSEVVSTVLEQIANVRNHRGLQTFSGDPNTSDPPAYQDFNYQLLHRTDNDTLYYWLPGDGTVLGAWDLLPISGSGLVIAGDGVTVPIQPILNFIGATVADDPTNGRTNVTISGSQRTFSTTGPPGSSYGSVPSGVDLSAYDEGHVWINTEIGRQWILKKTGGAQWYSQTMNFTGAPPATQTSSLIPGDTVTVAKWSWYWHEDEEWVENSCCDDFPDEPPANNGCPAGSYFDPVDGCTSPAPT